MKAIMLGLAVAIGGVLGWFYLDSTAGIPATISHTMETNVYSISGNSVPDKRQGVGTGVWIDEWYIITNCHVASAFIRQRMTEDTGNVMKTYYAPIRATSHDLTKVFSMEVIVCDKARDLALLKSSWPNHQAKRLDIEWVTPRFGSVAYSAGYRINLPMAPKVGYFGKIQRTINPRLGITMPIAQGDSGSPIFNGRGEIAAIASAVYAERTFQGAVIPIANIAVAIPGFAVRQLLEEQGYYGRER